MADKQSFNISRRNVLAGLGTIGLASAGAGLGTTAYFSDREDFENNTLVAGELDLKVDWQHMYWGPEEGSVYGTAGMPYVNAYPDVDGDGMQDTVLTRAEIAAADQSLTAEAVEQQYREQFADVPDDYADPVISLDDVKPGDHGCLGISVHLFDNPGYIWLGGSLVEESENGQNEPESKVDPTADGPGELADSIDATLWYDDNNDCELSDGIQGDGDVVIVLDRSGSMTFEPNKFENAKAGAKLLVDALGSNANIGLVSYSGSASLDVPLGSATASDSTVYASNADAVKGEIDDLASGGSTNMVDAVQTATTELLSGSSSNKIMVFLTNGNPSNNESDVVNAATAAKNQGIELYTVAYGSDANASLLVQMSSDPDSEYSYVSTDINAISQVFGQIGQSIAGETVITQGTLRQVLDALEAGIPLDGNRVAANRQCFVNSTTQYIGLKWELPVEVGNEIQTDSVTFDISFAAEQCRHNDGTNNPFAESV
ncbi:MAG: VWA domain-containing protein [Halobacteriota archaeon]